VGDTGEWTSVVAPGAELALTLDGAQPNPAVGRNMNVSFSLPAGTCFLRLTQGGKSVSKPVVVID
jgi:hypothetical protein